MSEEMHQRFMREAIALSQAGMEAGKGGPFGCVIVKDGEIVGRGFNRVTSSNDPTAHAEVVAIRDACTNLGTFQLDECVVYTSCEPCPMCLGALYWARPKAIFFANTREEAADIGFDDDFIYQEIVLHHSDRHIHTKHMPSDEALAVFRSWSDKTDRKEY